MTDNELTEIGEQVTKPKRKRPDRTNDLTVHTQPGDNAKYLSHSMKIFNLAAIDTNDAEAVRTRIQEYFDICVKDDMKPSVPGVAMSLGVDRRTLWTWVSGKTSKPADVLDAIKRVYQILDTQMDAYMQNGKINPVSGIFLMKNNHGYTDKQEVVVTPNTPLGDAQSREEIEQRYQNSVVDDTLTDETAE